MKNYEGYEEIQVTQLADMVHCLTKDGWKLLEIVTSGEIANTMNDVVRSGQCGQCNTYHTGGCDIIHGSVVITKPVFILGLSKDKTVTDLRDDLKLNKSTVDAQKREIQRLEQEAKGVDEALKESRRDVKSLHERVELDRESLKTKDLLEGHLQKARKIVGERDWKREVLGEKDEDVSG